MANQGELEDLCRRTVKSLRNQRYADRIVLAVKASSKVKKMPSPSRISSVIEFSVKSCVLNRDETRLIGKYTNVIMLATRITRASWRWMAASWSMVLVSDTWDVDSCCSLALFACKVL